MADLPLGLAVRDVRIARNLTQRQVAERMGALRIYISKVENARVVPMMEQFVRIAGALQIEPWRLLRYAEKLRAKLEAIDASI